MSKRVWVLGFVLTSLIFAYSSSLFAASERVVISVIVASNEGSDIDLDNDEYRDQLIELFSYASYKQEDQVLLELSEGESNAVSLPGGYDMSLTLQNAGDKNVTVRAVIKKGDVSYVDSVLSILKPGVVFMGGPQVNGGVLILVLEAGA